MFDDKKLTKKQMAILEKKGIQVAQDIIDYRGKTKVDMSLRTDENIDTVQRLAQADLTYREAAEFMGLPIATFVGTFGSIYSSSTFPTRDQLEQIEKLSYLGLPSDRIAEIMNVSVELLEEVAGEVLMKGSNDMHLIALSRFATLVESGDRAAVMKYLDTRLAHDGGQYHTPPPEEPKVQSLKVEFVLGDRDVKKSGE